MIDVTRRAQGFTVPGEMLEAIREATSSRECRVVKQWTHPFSTVAQVVCLEGTKDRVFLKVFHASWSTEPREAATHEYEALGHLWHHRKNAGFRIPEPLLLAQDPPAIAVEFLDGKRLDTNLHKILRRPWERLRVRSFARRLGEVGALLGRFSRVPPPATDKSTLGDMWKDASGRLAELRDSDLLTREATLALAEVLTETKEKVNLGTRARFSAHGDFGFWNILRNGRQFALVDFQRYGPGFRCSDLADAIARLERIVPMSAARQGRVQGCRQALIQGNGGVPAEELPEMQLLLIGSCLKLMQWEMRADRQGGMQKKIIGHLVKVAVEGVRSESAFQHGRP